ncbi:MAG: resolvase domain-containing protein [Bacteroidetes bacterium]|nr:MAG: resolvase domain-containing protein [Bacteroidota bacterium]
MMFTKEDLLSQFAKQKKTTEALNKNDCVIYTRVSTKEQAETNLSLDSQLKACNEFAAKRQLNCVEHFGGTYESAKSDERKEFQKMISAAKRKRIGSIIVYSYDRFSRTGANAIWLSRQLKELGINILSVTQPIDTNTTAGALQQNILFLFSQYDNDTRREKTITGMREKLMRGEWATKAPLGYDNIKKNGVKSIILNETGHLLKKAFHWKDKEKITDVEITERLAALGLTLSHKRLNEIFKNPFYCGFLTSTLIAGHKPVKGIHEPIVSLELFLRINKQKEQNAHGWQWDKENDNLPLKRFLVCDVCGWHWVGYEVKQKKIHYYKCNKKGCKSNVSAKFMHHEFLTILNRLQFDEKMVAPLRMSLLAELERRTLEATEDVTPYKKRLTELEGDINTLEERFALGKINEEMFSRFSSQYRIERNKLKEKIELNSRDYSNFEKYVDNYIRLALNAPSLWLSGGYRIKTTLQSFIFPDGLAYNEKTGQYRTDNINPIFGHIAAFTGGAEKKETGLFMPVGEKSGLVAGTGLEPMTFGL